MSVYTVAIDPGVEAGVAIFRTVTKRLELARTILPRSTGSWDVRCDEVVYKLESTIRLFISTNRKFEGFDRVYCEYPLYIDSPGGRSVARRGDLVKLAWICGMLRERCRGLCKEFVRVEVREWKGQLPKEVVNRRIKKIIPKDERRAAGMSPDCSHDWDAVGIGLWALKRK